VGIAKAVEEYMFSATKFSFIRIKRTLRIH